MKRFKRMYRNKIKIHYNTKINRVINSSAIFLIFIGIFLINNGLILRENMVPIYSYTAKKANYYEVILNPNTFYESEILPPNKYYASKSINRFAINFRYNFKGNKKENIEYNYNISAKLIGTVKNEENQEKEIWARKFMLSENSNNNQINNNEFAIDEQINIDYEYYNNLVRAYEDTYGIVINAELQVRLDVNYYINLSNLGVNNERVEDYIELDIPITNTVTEVKENYQDNTNKEIFIKNNNITLNEVIYYIIGALFIIGGITVIIVQIRQNSDKTAEEMYEENIRNIIKYYRDLIVTVTNEPNINNMQIMHIDKLEDLIDLAEQNSKNIILYEIQENKKSNLYVIIDNYAYIYVVTENNLK